MNWQRVRGAFLRQYYATIRSSHRIFEVFFWPIVDITLWGLISVHLRDATVPGALPISVLLGAALMWDVVFRGNLAVGVTVLEESWSRNVLNILAAPIKPSEYLAGAVGLGIAKVAVGWLFAAALAFAAYAFSITSIGLSLLPFLANLLLTGIVLGLVVVAMILRFGHGIEVIAWGLAFLVMPISAVFFPVTVLPGPVQAVAKAWPASHIFEGMRAVIAGGPTPWGQVAWASILNVVYLVLAVLLARWALATLRRRGFVTRYL